MPFPRLLLPILALAFAGAAAAASAANPPLPAFTAHYRVLHGGSPIGTATLKLAPGNDGAWTFTTDSKGTAGLASLLGASVSEASTFRWVGDLPQGESYDYTMSTALKQKHRRVRFDWDQHTIEVDDKGSFSYPTQPGAVERHTVVLALAAGLKDGKTSFTLPVAVRDRIQAQHFSTHGKQALTVPAGRFEATRISRDDGGDAFAAWFAPGKLPVPIRIDQRGDGDFSLELVDWSTP